MLDRIFYSLCSLTITSSLIILLIVILSPLLDKKYNENWKKCLWILLAIRLMIPYKFFFSRSILQFPYINKTINANGWTMSFTIFLLLIWIIGAFLYLNMQRLHFLHFKNHIIELSEEVDSTYILNIFDKVKAEEQFKKPVPLYYCEKIGTPMTLGVLNPFILLPSLDYGQNELENIFHHELTHIKSHDGIYKICILCITAIYWFNPLIYLMAKLSYRDIEFICDKKVTKHMNSVQRGEYSKTILSLSPDNPNKESAFLSSFWGSKKMLKKRIEKIFEKDKQKSGYPFLSIIFLLFLVSNLLFSYSNTNATPHGNAEDHTQNYTMEPTNLNSDTKPSEEIYYSEGGVHPYNKTIPTDLALCTTAKEKLFNNLSEDDKNYICTQIREAHWWIEAALVYSHNLSKDGLVEWNQIHYTTDRFDDHGVTIIVSYPGYTGDTAIDELTKVKNMVNNAYFSMDIDRAVQAMQEAIATHNAQYLFLFHQILHDMDYWLINYPIQQFEKAPADWHGIYVSFGILKSYECVK